MKRASPNSSSTPERICHEFDMTKVEWYSDLSVQLYEMGGEYYCFEGCIFKTFGELLPEHKDLFTNKYLIEKFKKSSHSESSFSTVYDRNSRHHIHTELLQTKQRQILKKGGGEDDY
jgi:hypothetical protein